MFARKVLRQRGGRLRKIALPRLLVAPLLVLVVTTYHCGHVGLYVHPPVLPVLSLLVGVLRKFLARWSLVAVLRGTHPLSPLVQLAGLLGLKGHLGALFSLAITGVTAHLLVLVHAVLAA